jgi:hypothetical protein
VAAVIRRVAFGKALLAGAAGALVWEAVARVFIWTGVPNFDIVYVLGTMVLGRVAAWRWWPVGMGLHVMVGVIWAIFYAYFFWSAFDWRPAVQGLAFSLGPAVLAGLVMVPQMGWMHPLVVQGEMPHPGIFGLNLGRGGLMGVLLGHVAYGATLGSLYTRPVGHATGRRTMRRA